MAAFNDGRVMPPGYEPFQYLDVCGNLLENVKVIFEIANVVPLLVGRGEQFPKIWLTLPWPPRGVIQADQKWILAVDGDQMPERLIEPLRSTLRLEKRVAPVPTVEVWLGQAPVLRVRQEDKLTGRIDFIDLRPLGLAISGSPDGLQVAGSHFKANRFQNIGVMIKIG